MFTSASLRKHRGGKTEAIAPCPTDRKNTEKKLSYACSKANRKRNNV